MTDLHAFLGQAAARPVVWGAWDCHLWLADWVLAHRGGEDPAEGFRGRYRTPRGALRLLKREGGSTILVPRLAERAGLAAAGVLAPHPGAIGMLPIKGQRGIELIGGIYTGARWAVLGRPGLLFHPLIATRAWTV